MKFRMSVLALCLLGFSHASWAGCPSVEGTWGLEGSDAPFYIVNNADGEAFQVWLPQENKEYQIFRVIPLTKDKREKEQIDACATLIQEVGILTKSKKGDDMDVMTQSQEFTTRQTINTDYIIMVFAGFGYGFVGVTKINDQLPDALKNGTLPLVESDRNARNYQQQLARAEQEAAKNNPAAQLMLAKSSSLAVAGTEYGEWTHRKSVPDVRQHWLDKATANNYGPGWCFKAETKVEKADDKTRAFKYTEAERIVFYKKALAAGNAPMAGVRLAELTRNKNEKIEWLTKAVQQGSLTALWQLDDLTSGNERKALPAEVQASLKNPPVENLRKSNPTVWESYNEYMKGDKEHLAASRDPFKFDLPQFIESGYNMSDIAALSGSDKDYENRRTDCIEKDLLKLSDYPQ